MRLTVLGSSASYAGAGQACAGYLVENEDTAVLLDCGNGVLANLARVRDPLELDAVFVTHEHVDHFADVFALQALLRYAPQGPAPALPLYLPDGLFETMQGVLGERGAEELAAAFVPHPLVSGERVRADGIEIEPRLVEHTEATYGLRVRAASALLCYTSDTAPGETVADAMRGADLLLAEATLPEQYAGRARHMTAHEAGEVAKAAGACRLLLTHIWPTTDRDQARHEATMAFEGPVGMAEELARYEIETTFRDEEAP